MADAQATSKASIAGILCIVAGGMGVFGGLILSAIGLVATFLPLALADDVPIVAPLIVTLIFGPLALLLLGIGGLAIAGGLAGVRRTRWGMLVLGAAASIVCFAFLGIPALVLAIMAEREFLPAATAPPPVPSPL